MSWRLKRAMVLAPLLAACSAPEPWAALSEGETGRVVRVIDGDSIVLDTGLAVRLVAIEAPRLSWRDRPADPHGEVAKRVMEDLALGRRVRLYYAGLTRDRYDRALAHAVTADELGPTLWLNGEMVARGAARLRVYPDTARGAEHLAALEMAARADGVGLWALEAYAIRRASEVSAELTGFHLVEGVLGPALAGNGGQACERAFLGSAIVLDVAWPAESVCGLASGTRLVARGFLRDGRLELSHPLNAELLNRDRAATATR